MPSFESRRAVICPEITEIEATEKRSGEKRLWSSSIEKSIALIGAPVASEKPAQAPPVIIYRRHPTFFLPPKIRTVPSPIALPICTQGPSVPSGIPQRKVRKADMGRTKALESHFMSVTPFIAVIVVGIPPPLQVGQSERMRLDISPIAAVPISKQGSHTGYARTVSYICEERRITSSAIHLNAVINTAEKTPVATEKTRQGKRRFLI